MTFMSRHTKIPLLSLVVALSCRPDSPQIEPHDDNQSQGGGIAKPGQADCPEPAAEPAPAAMVEMISGASDAPPPEFDPARRQLVRLSEPNTTCADIHPTHRASRKLVRESLDAELGPLTEDEDHVFHAVISEAGLASNECRKVIRSTLDSLAKVNPQRSIKQPKALSERVCSSLRDKSADSRWASKTLFADASREMPRYCLYEWSGDGEPRVDALPEAAQPDRLISLGSPGGGFAPPPLPPKLRSSCPPRGQCELGDSACQCMGHIRNKLVDDFWHDAGMLEQTPPSDFEGNVTIAIIDTAPPDACWNEAISEHGPAMAAFARAAVGETPSVRIEHYLGLPCRMVAGLPDCTPSTPSQGGHFGYQSHLAAAILDATEAWQDAPEDTRGKLIISLSVGWEPGSTAPGNPVADAIQSALDKGALVFAASGNQTPLSCLEGPVAPAVLEPAMPGVRAVTGVNGRFGPLATFRPGSNAGLAAVGYLATTSEYGPMSGSSVATIIVASTAALVWAKYPSFDPATVLSRLESLGTASSTPVDFFSSSTPDPKQVIVKPCEIVNRLTDCTMGSCYCRPGRRIPVDIQAHCSKMTARTACSSSRYTMSCDRAIVDPSHAWVKPQPDLPLCGVCGVDYTSGNGHLYITIDPAYQTLTPLAMTVTLNGPGGVSTVLNYEHSSAITGPNLMFHTSNITLFYDPSFGSHPPESAYVVMKFADGTTARDELAILKP
jgi:hypothetical protein